MGHVFGRQSRRRFLVVGLAGVFAAACGPKVESIERRGKPQPTPQPTPLPQPTPTPAPQAAPASQPGPTGRTAPGGPAPRPPAAGPVVGGPLGVAQPVLGGPAGPQNLVIPVLPARTAPYANRLAAPERLIIPGIGLDAKVISISTRYDKDGQLVWETAPFAVGHHKGTGLPGETGNVVLSGHVSSRSEGAIFSKLPNVEVGDGVIVITPERHHLYRVVETAVVKPDAVQFVDRTDASVATLITCVPDGVYSHRLIVRAEAV